MKDQYTLKELESMTTLEQGHEDDLKIQTPRMRVWLSRMGVEDGQPYNNQVTIEMLNNGRWEITEQYEAK